MKKQNILILAAVVIAVAGIAFASSKRGKGTLTLATPGAQLQLATGWFDSTTLTSKQGAVQMQEGLYRPSRAAIQVMNDDKTKSWFLSSRGPWGKLASIRVDKGQATTVRLGPPITLHADVQRAGRDVLIGLALIGQAGEHWSPMVMMPQGMAPAPGVRILDEAGKVLAEGRFAYG